APGERWPRPRPGPPGPGATCAVTAPTPLPLQNHVDQRIRRDQHGAGMNRRTDVLRGPVLGCQYSYGSPLVLKNKNGGRRVARSTKWRCPDFEIVALTSPARTGTFFQGGTPMDAVTDVPRPVNEPV